MSEPISKTLAQVFPCEFYKIFMKTLFTNYLRTTASELSQVMHGVYSVGENVLH